MIKRLNSHKWGKASLAIICVLLLYIIVGQTNSRYYGILMNDTDLLFAPWKIKINGEFVRNAGEVNIPATVFVDEANSSSTCATANRTGKKLIPGCIGYFDIEINPTGTGVSLMYEINFNKNDLPGGMMFTAFSTDNGITKIEFPDDYIITGEMKLVDDKVLDESDTLYYRVYYDYVDDDELNTTFGTPEKLYGVTVKIEQLM